MGPLGSLCAFRVFVSEATDAMGMGGFVSKVVLVNYSVQWGGGNAWGAWLQKACLLAGR